jgi:hypothetical protein
MHNCNTYHILYQHYWSITPGQEYTDRIKSVFWRLWSPLWYRGAIILTALNKPYVNGAMDSIEG